MELLGVISCARAVLFSRRGRGETMSDERMVRVVGLLGAIEAYEKEVTEEEAGVFLALARRLVLSGVRVNYVWRDGTFLIAPFDMWFESIQLWAVK